MSTQEFLTFRKYNDRNLAQGLAEVLQEQGIDCMIMDESNTFNPAMTTTLHDQEYRVVIKAHDFEKVQALLLTLSAEQLNDVDPDYYLFSFTNEELMELLAKPDEWNEFDAALAPKILKDRGIVVDDAAIASLRNRRWDDLYQPERLPRFWFYLGYVTAFLGGLIGIVTGWTLAYTTKQLPNGQRVPRYVEEDRKHGGYMFLIGCVVFTLSILLKIFQVIGR